MEKLDEKILKYCGIYRTNKPYENIDKALKKKKELEKLTGLKIEKAYIFGDSYWGKEETDSNPIYCFLVDERVKSTTYANVMREFSRNRKYFKSNENDILMKQLIEIYILKIGYFVDIDMEISLKELIEYVGYINNDNKVKEILTKEDEYIMYVLEGKFTHEIA